jgi:hypothetical protein
VPCGWVFNEFNVPFRVRPCAREDSSRRDPTKVADRSPSTKSDTPLRDEVSREGVSQPLGIILAPTQVPASWQFRGMHISARECFGRSILSWFDCRALTFEARLSNVWICPKGHRNHQLRLHGNRNRAAEMARARRTFRSRTPKIF